MAAVTTTNGTLTPPDGQIASVASASPGTKRKRSDSDTHEQVNGVSSEYGARQSALLKDTLAHILEYLKGFDTTPSILNLPIPHDDDRTSSVQPTSKRQKPSSTIASKIQSNAYESIEALSQDIEIAASQLLTPLRVKEAGQVNGSNFQVSLLSPDESRHKTSVLVFKKAFNNIALRRLVQKPLSTDDGVEKSSINGAITIETADDEGVTLRERRSALTLYGQAQGPKQLFSSLQKPQHVHLKGLLVGEEHRLSDIDLILPIQETILPHIITTTDIVPPPSDEVVGSKRKRNPTIGEVFPTPTAVQLIAPPKPNKILMTRDSTISFVKNDNLPKPNQTGVPIYPIEKLAVGKWLGYDHVEINQEPSVKRKQRDRALSTGKAEPMMTENIKAALEQAKVDALFRSVYSSFAPSKDDSAAVVPSETKDKLWWSKVGEKRFEQVLILDPALAAIDAQNAEDQTEPEEDVLDEELIKDAIENFEPVEDPFQDKENKDTEDILQQISELLETLHSHQRIRNASLPTKSIVTDSGTKQLAGSPTDPSSAEVDVYFILRDQLALMIGQLPPFAVAKLNGDQLADLNISRKIVTERMDYKGVMEEDVFSRLAKQAAVSSAVGTPSVNRSHTQYSATPNPYTRATPVSQPTRLLQGPQAYPQRPQQPVGSYQRPTSTSGQFGTPAAYAANGHRPGYPASYSQQSPRPNVYSTNAASAFYQNRPQPSNYNAAYYQNAHTPGGPSPQVRAYAQAPASASAYSPRPGGVPAYSGSPAATYQSPSIQRTANSAGYGFGQRPSVGYPAGQLNGQQNRGYFQGNVQQATPGNMYPGQTPGYQKPSVGTPQTQRVNGM